MELTLFVRKVPNYKSYEIQDNQVILHFENVFDGFKPDSLYVGFEIAGNDQVFYPANAVLNSNNTIALSSRSGIKSYCCALLFSQFRYWKYL